MNNLKTLLSLLILFLIIVSCSQIKNKLSGDRLYFVEKYTESDKEVGESKTFPPGKVTVMLKLTKSIGVSSVDINITNINKNEVYNTFPFTVQSDWDYIHFDDVNFDTPGKYKVSCLKKDKTVIASNEIEIK